MKIQFLDGGLANQAFQYIFAKYYELSHPGEIMYMDDSYFALNTVHNGYELDKVFGIKPHMLSECFDEEVWNYILAEKQKRKSVPQILCENGIEMYMISEVGEKYKKDNPFEGKVYSVLCNHYFPQIFEAPGDVYYHGFWINKNWFVSYKEHFLQEFSFPEIKDVQNKEYLEKIQNSQSVSIHIRRGDYIDVGWAYGIENYRKMTEEFVRGCGRKWELFVFSDDIEWCKEKQEELGFGLFERVTFVEGNVCGKNYIDMQLMSQCKGMIMSNSAFCYLAALLNVRKQVYINPTWRAL